MLLSFLRTPQGPAQLRNQFIALAAVAQSCVAVRGLAETGNCDANVLSTCLSSIMKTAPDSVESVYNNQLGRINQGAHTLRKFLNNQMSFQDTQLKHCYQNYFTLISLSKKLYKREQLQQQLGQQLQQIERQLKHYDISHPAVISSLAQAYVDTFGQFIAKVHIVGKKEYLQQNSTVEKIRALLLSGARSSILWLQMGGSRVGTLYQHRLYPNVIEELVQECKQSLENHYYD